MTEPKCLTEYTPSELRARIDRLHHYRERYRLTERRIEIRSCDLEIAEATRALAIINRRATEAEDQRVADLRKSIIEICEDKLYRIGFHSGGSFGVEYDSDSKTKLLGEIADAIAVSIGIPPQAQREAELREAVLHGVHFAQDRAQVTDCGAGPSIDWVDEGRAEEEASRFARSKAGG